MTSLKASAVLIVAALSLAACDFTPPVLPGNLKMSSSAIVTKCNPDNLPGKTHTCVVFSNPYISNFKVKNVLRIFDATTHQFVRAPNAYSALSVPLVPTEQNGLQGSARHLGQFSKTSPYLYALDTPSKTLYKVLTQNVGATETTFAPAKSYALPFAHEGFTLVTYKNENRAIFSNENSLSVREIDTSSGDLTSKKSHSIEIVPEGTVLNLVATKTHLFILVNDKKVGAKNDRHMVKQIPIKALFSGNASPVDLFESTPESQIIDIQASQDGQKENLLIVLRTHNDVNQPYLAEFYRFIQSPKNIGSVKLKNLPTQAYIPLKESTCCKNKLDNWVAILESDGRLNYISLADNQAAIEVSYDLFAAKHLGIRAKSPLAFLGAHNIADNDIKTAAPDKLKACSHRSYFLFATGLFAASCAGGEDFFVIN